MFSHPLSNFAPQSTAHAPALGGVAGRPGPDDDEINICGKVEDSEFNQYGNAAADEQEEFMEANNAAHDYSRR
jgi:hypothetical protein